MQLHDGTGRILVLVASIPLGLLAMFLVFEALKIWLLNRRLDSLDNLLASAMIDTQSHRKRKRRIRQRVVQRSMLLRWVAR